MAGEGENEIKGLTPQEILKTGFTERTPTRCTKTPWSRCPWDGRCGTSSVRSSHLPLAISSSVRPVRRPAGGDLHGPSGRDFGVDFRRFYHSGPSDFTSNGASVHSPGTVRTWTPPVRVIILGPSLYYQGKGIYLTDVGD